LHGTDCSELIDNSYFLETRQMRSGASNVKWWLSLAVIACVVLTGGLASAQGLAAVGPTNSANGYPLWYQDFNGLRLELCLTQTGFCITTEPNPNLPISFPDNFGEENFYFLAESAIDLPGGGLAFYRSALESSFINGAVINGDQIVFTRIRFRVDLPHGGTYTITHPYGVETFTVAAGGRRAINFTSDIGLAPGLFTLALSGGVGPFLHSATGNVTDGAGHVFLANPILLVQVTGSPFGTNFFQIDGPDIGGPGVNSIRTDLFTLVGQIFTPPQSTTSLTSSPNPSTVAQAVTLTATVNPVAPGFGVPTGNVTFRDGASTLGVAALVNGSASFVTSALAAGAHSLTAVYNGSADFQASTSAVVIQIVNAPPATATSTSLNSSPNPSSLGQTVTLSATVTPVPPASGTPTGTVTFRDGAAALATVPLVGGSASFNTSTLTVGSHSLTAVYNGSASFAASTSAVRTQVVNPGNTTTSLTSSPNPSTVGQTVTLSSTVSPVAPASGIPTGSITFRDGATTLGVVALVNGSASLSISTLTVGSHSLTAVYSGSTTFAASTSPTVTQIVNAPAAAATSTSLTSSPNPSTFGQTVTLSSTVTSGAGVPTGTVTFRDGATVLGTATLVNGSASLSISTLAVGSHPLTALYGGSATFAASTSAVVTQVVNAAAAAATTTTLTSTPNPSTTGQAVTLSATVTSAAGVPTGTVTFRDGATMLVTATLVNGSASISISTLAAGSHPLTAAYGGSATFAASTSAVVTQVVNAPAPAPAPATTTTTTLTSTPNPSTTGQAVTLSATVTAATGVPTGTVTFRDGSTVLGAATLVNGSASMSVSTLAVGTRPLTALYGGSATFLPSTSAVVTQAVNAPGAAATTTTLTSTPNPSTTGQAVSLSATVTAATGVPTGTVTFRDGANVLGTVTLVNGSASLSVSMRTTGTHPLTATYNGSATFAISISATVNQVVNAAPKDTVTITRSELTVATGELLVEGTNTQIPGGGFAAGVTIWAGAAAANGASCTGVPVGSAPAVGGAWQFRQVTPLRPTTICVQSSGGGVASGAVTQK
jgi:hypothetical protein